METDKKIEEYLERALKIYKTIYPERNEHLISDRIEIAKMIQLEEHREQYSRMEQTEDGLLTVFRNSAEKYKKENLS